MVERLYGLESPLFHAASGGDGRESHKEDTNLCAGVFIGWWEIEGSAKASRVRRGTLGGNLHSENSPLVVEPDIAGPSPPSR